MDNIHQNHQFVSPHRQRDGWRTKSDHNSSSWAIHPELFILSIAQVSLKLHPCLSWPRLFELIIMHLEKNIVFHTGEHVSTIFCANFQMLMDGQADQQTENPWLYHTCLRSVGKKYFRMLVAATILNGDFIFTVLCTNSADKIKDKVRGMFEMNCLFLSGDFKFQVSPKVFISCPRSTPRG